jgi:hypothetical protein
LPLPWSVILHSPRDLDDLWQKIENPDLLVIRPDQAEALGPRSARAGELREKDQVPWTVQSVEIAGRVSALDADLTASIAIVVKGPEAVWVPIRLDGARVARAREGSRELLLRMGDRAEWQVQVAGPGEHRIEVDFKATVRADPARQWLSVPIPEAASTRLALDFAAHEADIVVGSNEDYGVKDLGEGRPRQLVAHLSPRAKLEVSWARGENSAAGSSVLLSAQGEIAVDIDEDEMRTRSSWIIRCVRGMTRELELQINPEDKPTELLVDDQPTEGGIERKAGTLAIPLGDVLRPGKAKHVVLKTRRPFKNPAARHASFSGFPITAAREQSGFIGVIQSPNLWVSPVPTRGARQIDPRELPTDLRARPSTNLAFEFREQPFQLDLAVEPLPPIVKTALKTTFWVDPEKARSETAIDLFWVRGRLYDLELEVPASLQNVSIEPREFVERSTLTSESTSAPGGQPARILKIRLTSMARDQEKVALRVNALEPIPPDGLARLGLMTPLHTTSVAATYELVAESSLALELDDESGMVRRSTDAAASSRAVTRDGISRGRRENGGSSPLLLVTNGNAKELPVRIRRQRRTVTHETEISAQLSRRAIDIIQQTNVAVHSGVLGSLEILVPAAIADRWELFDKEIADRTDLGPGPDGSRRYRLTFQRPVLDKLALRFRGRLPIVPVLDSKKAREIVLPQIIFREGPAGATRVGLSLAPEIQLEANDASWVRSSDDINPQAGDKGTISTFVHASSDRGLQPFSFKAVACETIRMPSVLIPRLLIKTSLTEDGSQDRVWCWVESHGAHLAFAIPQGARWLGARVDGRIVEQVDYDPAQLRYRLRFPGEVGSRPALVELQYRTSGEGGRRRLEAPRFLDGEVVLQSVWEVRVPENHAILGVPQGWFDENQPQFGGYDSSPGLASNSASLRGWLLGAALTPSISAIDYLDETRFDESHRSVFAFSRSGEPVALSIWVVARSWLVVVCSGAALFLGFLAIFSRARFRTIWLVLAALGLLAAAFIPTSVLFLVLQSAVIGLALTVLGLAIRSVIERSRGMRLPARESSLLTVRPPGDSGLDRSSGVGSDDSTAIRVRVPSTVDLAPTPAAESPVTD